MVTKGLFIILDGWGHSEETAHNAVRQAQTPNFDHLTHRFPTTLLEASGRAVGLSAGTPGNSEVGHMTLGSGRVIEYESTRVEAAMANGTLQTHPVLVASLQRVRSRGGAVHLVGLLSDGNVHAHLSHFRPLVEAAARQGLDAVFLHLFTDGRDSPNGTALPFLQQMEEMLATVGAGRVASIIGRDYAMDRNGNWHKTAAAYELLVAGTGTPVRSAAAAIQSAYAAYTPDDRIPPAAVVDADGVPIGRVQDGDLLIAVNFRGDRMHQLLQAFVSERLTAFPRSRRPAVEVLTLTDYHMEPALPCLFEHLEVRDTLADVLDGHGLRNLRVSETEKFPHVTFFFDGREERPHPFARAVHVPGPKVRDYRQTPEMNAAGIVREVQAALERGEDALIVANLVNADILGHTGDMAAVIRAVETVDHCLGQLVTAALAHGYWVVACGDHGNAETMYDPALGLPHVGHTTNPVPFVLIHPGFDGSLRPGGSLADVAPTLLHLLGVPQPPAMTGESLIRSGGRTGVHSRG